MTGIARSELMDWLEHQMQASQFKDYGPNGLQVEGRARIGRVVSGVTASLALIEAAVEAQADAILVHHGLFWRGQSGVVTGWMRQRLALLLAHDINLIAYHLPLDAHPMWGNNVQLARILAIEPTAQRFGDLNLGWCGHVEPQKLHQWQSHTESILQRPAMVVGDPERLVQRVGWCTGGAQGYFEQAIDAGVDVFMTGEISEPQAHLARETGVAFMACGHHATERYGAPAMAQALADAFGLEHQWIEVDNPA